MIYITYIYIYIYLSHRQWIPGLLTKSRRHWALIAKRKGFGVREIRFVPAHQLLALSNWPLTSDLTLQNGASCSYLTASVGRVNRWRFVNILQLLAKSECSLRKVCQCFYGGAALWGPRPSAIGNQRKGTSPQWGEWPHSGLQSTWGWEFFQKPCNPHRHYPVILPWRRWEEAGIFQEWADACMVSNLSFLLKR